MSIYIYTKTPEQRLNEDIVKMVHGTIRHSAKRSKVLRPQNDPPVTSTPIADMGDEIGHPWRGVG